MIRHLLEIGDLSPAELRAVVDLSSTDPENLRQPLAGAGVALIFEKPSARTRHSAEIAVVQLGGHPVYTRAEEVGLDARESVEDVTRILAGYHRLLGARVFAHSTLRRMAAVSPIPVVNLLSDTAHPLQAIADIVTMETHVGPVAKMTVAWVGDFNNVARSLTEAVTALGGTMRVSTPPGHGPTGEDLARAEAAPGALVVVGSPSEAVEGCHVVHTDTWISMGQEADSDARRATFRPWQVDGALMARAPGAYFMHCMPAHRGEEVSAEVFDGPMSLVIEQGHARLASARGAFAWLCQRMEEGK